MQQRRLTYIINNTLSNVTSFRAKNKIIFLFLSWNSCCTRQMTLHLSVLFHCFPFLIAFHWNLQLMKMRHFFRGFKFCVTISFAARNANAWPRPFSGLTLYSTASCQHLSIFPLFFSCIFLAFPACLSCGTMKWKCFTFPNENRMREPSFIWRKHF